MKNILKYTHYITVFCLVNMANIYGQINAKIRPAGERFIVFDRDWKFKKDKNSAAKEWDFNDSNWRTLDLPHDWSIENLSNMDSDSVIGPFSKKSAGRNATGWTIGGTAWYRKTFQLDQNTVGKKVYIRFDGVYMNSDVWINGQHLGNHPNGYTAFLYDLTPFLKPVGQKNVIAVEIKNEGDNSRWYTGSGIYRHVWLLVVNNAHIDNWGVKIESKNSSEKSTNLHITTQIKKESANSLAYSLTTEIYDATGKLVATQNTKEGTSNKIEQVIALKNPQLWSIETPYLYKAKVILKQKGNKHDEYTQLFGVRSIEISAIGGFKLNGKKVQLRGACLHHDNGYLGTAAIKRAEIRKVELLKKSGFNAIRCAHNPPSEAFLNACDQMGMLVINEFTDVWENYKNPDDYSNYFTQNWEEDLTAMMKRDWNHPSIIMWSIGNEIPKKSIEEGVKTAKKLISKVKELDSSRFVTEAVPSFLVHGGWKNTYNYFDLLDVSGYNYMYKKYEEDHDKYPNRVIYGSESFPNEAFDYWDAVEQKPYVIGDFVWTGMDYIGEVALGTSKYVKEIKPSKMQTMDGIPVGTNPKLIFDYMTKTPSLWPNYLSWCGDLDLMGDKKPQSLYRDVLWNNSTLEMNVHEPIPEGLLEEVSLWGWPNEKPIWDWPGSEDKPLGVRVFSKASSVRLELNGAVIGEKEISKSDKYIANFVVPYQAGKLTAIAFNGGKEIARKVFVTPKVAHKLKLTADRITLNSDKQDLSFVKVEVLDIDGNLVTNHSVEIQFSIEGVGQIVATGNANPRDMQSVNKLKLQTFNGKAQAVIRATGVKGKVTVKVDGQYLASDAIDIHIK